LAGKSRENGIEFKVFISHLTGVIRPGWSSRVSQRNEIRMKLIYLPIDIFDFCREFSTKIIQHPLTLQSSGAFKIELT
jgi:hypothetical protein